MCEKMDMRKPPDNSLFINTLNRFRNGKSEDDGPPSGVHSVTVSSNHAPRPAGH